MALYRSRLQRSPIQALDAIGEEAGRRDEQVTDVDEADAWLERQLEAPSAITRVYDARNFAPYNPAAGVQVGARSAAGLPNAAMSWAVLSVYPPQGLYRSPPEVLEGRWKLTEAHDWERSDLKAPVWKGKATHMPQVPQDPSSLLVVDERCLDKLGPSSTSGLAGAIKFQGWAVLPLFGGSSGSVDSGLHMLPILEGAPHLEALA